MLSPGKPDHVLCLPLKDGGHFMLEKSQFLELTTSAQSQIGAFAPPYPNPASALTCIPVHLKQDAHVKVTLIDALGRTIEVIHDGMLYDGETKLFFQASGIPAGAYVISLENNEARLATSRIMIQ